MSQPPSVGRGRVRPHVGRVSFSPFFPGDASASWVRVALVHEGAIIAERRIAPDHTLTWGHSERAELNVPGAALSTLGACDVLVRPGPRGPELVVPGGASGRLVTDEGDVDVQGSVGQAVALGAACKGRVQCGEFALLIARCEAPPKRQRPQLPASVEGGLLRHADWTFTAFVAASLIAHGSLVTVLSELDFPYQDQNGRDHVATQIFIEDLLPDFEAPLDPIDVAEPAQDSYADADPEHGESAPDSVEAPTRSVRRPRVSSDVVASAEPVESIDPSSFADEIGQQLTLGVAGSRGLEDLIARGAPTPGQADILASVTGTALATREPGAMRDRSVAPGEIVGDVGSLRRTATGPRGEGGGPLDERRITVAAPPPHVFDPERGGDPQDTDLVRAIRGRMGAVRACYERELRDQPDLAGRLVVQVTAQLSGTLSGVRTLEDTMHSERLEGCVEEALRTVRLRQPPTDEPLTASFPLVFASQQ